MQPIATVVSSVCVCVCLFVCVCVSVGHIRKTCKTGEPIEMPFRRLARVGPRNHVLHGVVFMFYICLCIYRSLY